MSKCLNALTQMRSLRLQRGLGRGHGCSGAGYSVALDVGTVAQAQVTAWPWAWARLLRRRLQRGLGRGHGCSADAPQSTDELYFHRSSGDLRTRFGSGQICMYALASFSEATPGKSPFLPSISTMI
jgi:hypothetical protein